jgi:hypothetical protein
LKRGNWRGAVNKLRSGLAYLAPSSPICMGIIVAQLHTEAGHVLAQLEELGLGRIGEVDTSALPQVQRVKH